MCVPLSLCLYVAAATADLLAELVQLEHRKEMAVTERVILSPEEEKVLLSLLSTNYVFLKRFLLQRHTLLTFLML
jgi:hypothetical protein